jgi:hypothetical protein
MVPVTVSAWSMSSFAADIEGADAAVSCEAADIVDDAEDVAVEGSVALSVAFSSKLYVWPAVRVLPAMLQVMVLPAICPDPLFVEHCVAAAYTPPLSETIQLYV